jgi:predicted nucleic-acid-binding Zn-ribbon protein
MKNGQCPKCGLSNVYFKPYALDKVTLDGRSVEYVDYVCTDCGYFETYITNKDALSRIPNLAEKLGDWKKAN